MPRLVLLGFNCFTLGLLSVLLRYLRLNSFLCRLK